MIISRRSMIGAAAVLILAGAAALWQWRSSETGPRAGEAAVTAFDELAEPATRNPDGLTVATPSDGNEGPPAEAAAAAPGSASAPSPGPDQPAARPQPLPPLVRGNPLTDDHFAHLSSKIVIAAVGFQGQADWEVKVVEYMDKVLTVEGVTPEQYEEYAQALTRNVERGAAVAENILRRVEAKLGTRMEVEALPMFKFDESTRRSIEQKLHQ
jgi:hypothetical protein